uniref:(northern house mosquito) hypothetical protein n=1 Tax=Culex pipiens TaxID=7175 RepID=A0A8D8HDU5_CULPI
MDLPNRPGRPHRTAARTHREPGQVQRGQPREKLPRRHRQLHLRSDLPRRRHPNHPAVPDRSRLPPRVRHHPERNPHPVHRDPVSHRKPRSVLPNLVEDHEEPVWDGAGTRDAAHHVQHPKRSYLLP